MPALLRTVGWCGIAGFEQWWRRLAQSRREMLSREGWKNPLLRLFIEILLLGPLIFISQQIPSCSTGKRKICFTSVFHLFGYLFGLDSKLL
jgi:hypothetical protein